MSARIRLLAACALAASAALSAPARAQTPANGGAAAAAPTAPGDAQAVRFLVVASSESSLSAAGPGRIASVAVGLGDAVRAGQVLAQLDCGDTSARRDAARADLTSARLQHEAKMKLQGLQSAAEVEVELAAANVDRAQSQIRIFDAQLAQCNFVAPFAGRVARVHVKVGQGVTAGAPVVDLVGTGALKARLNVPSSWLARIKPGTVLNATVDETASTHDLRVTRIAARVDAVSQTAEIEAAFVGRTGSVLPGMSGKVR